MSKNHRPGEQLAYPAAEGTRLPYLLHIPSEYGQDKGKKWPLILFLHGAGERGDDMKILREFGPAKEAEKKPDFPFICVSPQCPDDELWFGFIGDLKTLIDRISASFEVDMERVYLTGFSMGGFGAWAMALIYPEMFAALVPICGGGTV
ncbi:MAG: alpha/beta hydrolase-fold protein [Candidatus Promineifilaceae bacterium]